jgi:hypothetical protein
MSRPEAEEQSDTAAESTFIIDEGILMLLAISIAVISPLEYVGCALRADKLLRFVL